VVRERIGDATDPAALGNDFYGPYGRFQNSGSATKVSRARHAHDHRAALRLWELSTAATGADHRVLDAPLSRGRLA
jgi:hypothetical protein